MRHGRVFWVAAVLSVMTGACAGSSGGSQDGLGDQQSGDLLQDQRANDARGADQRSEVLDAHVETVGEIEADLVTTDLPADQSGETLVTDIQEDQAELVMEPAEEAALKELFPLADQFQVKLLGEDRYFEAFQGSASLGVAFEGMQYGFNSMVVSMTAVTPQGVTVALEIVSQWESWWYALEGDQGFWDQFKEVDTSLIDVPKQSLTQGGADPVDAVTGATYSSQAVIGGFWQAMEQYERYRD